MPQLRVLLGFASAPDHSLEERAQAVLDNLYDNADFPDPPVSEADFETALNDFRTSMAAAEQGGPADTALKNNKRQALITHLRALAGFVQNRHGNDLAKLLSTGFEAVSTNNASSPLETPNIKEIDNDGPGELIVRVTPVRNAKGYQARHALVGPDGAPGPWSAELFFTNSRAMLLTGLQPGGLYMIEVRAMGGSTGQSDWSHAVSRRSL